MNRILILALLSPALAGAGAEAYQRIVAKVGGEIVTSFDVESALRLVEAPMSRPERESAEGKKRLDEARKKILDRMIEEKLVVLAAEKGPEGWKEAQERGTAPPNPYVASSLEVEEELEKTFEDARSRFRDQGEFEEELKKERISVSEFRQRLRERLRAQLTFQRMVKSKEKEFQPSLRVADEEAKAFYEEHKSLFAVGEQVSLRHVLYRPAERAKAEAAAQKLKASARPKEDFIALAKRESADEASAGKGGRLGWIEKGGLRWKEVEAAAFKLAPGQAAGPLRSEEGWHLVLVDEKKAGEQKSFEETKAQVRNIVYQQKMRSRIEAWVEDLKREFFVERSDG